MPEIAPFGFINSRAAPVRLLFRIETYKILKSPPPQPTFQPTVCWVSVSTQRLATIQDYNGEAFTFWHHSLLSINWSQNRPNQTTDTKIRLRKASSRNSAMNSDSPPPSDACPELTSDNGTPTSSTPGSVNGTGVNHQASRSRLNNTPEQNNVAARVPPTGGSRYTRSPYPAPTALPSIELRGHERTEAIPFLSIGSPLVPLSRNPWSPRLRSASAVRFASEPTVTPRPRRRPLRRLQHLLDPRALPPGDRPAWLRIFGGS